MLIFDVISFKEIILDYLYDNLDHIFIKDAYSLHSVTFVEIGNWKEQFPLPLEAYHFNSMKLESTFLVDLYSC